MLRAYQCPFFKWEGKREIHCEGGDLRFLDGLAMREYIDEYCALNPEWQGCSLAGNIAEAYKRKELENGEEC